MKKYIFITNGMARCGKDTFYEFMNQIVPTCKYSSIDWIKGLATLCGWDGGKTERDRKFLSDLKILVGDYSDKPFNAIRSKVERFQKSNANLVLLIDIREPEEIERAKKEFDARTILIKNDRVATITSNPADAGVYRYKYDFVVENNGTLEEFRETVRDFVYKNLGI